MGVFPQIPQSLLEIKRIQTRQFRYDQVRIRRALFTFRGPELFQTGRMEYFLSFPYVYRKRLS